MALGIPSKYSHGLKTKRVRFSDGKGLFGFKWFGFRAIWTIYIYLILFIVLTKRSILTWTTIRKLNFWAVGFRIAFGIRR